MGIFARIRRFWSHPGTLPHSRVDQAIAMQPDPDLSAEIQRFEEQYAENPDSLVFARLADAYRKAGETERALAVLEGGLERHPDYASAHVVRARLLRETGRHAEAEDAFRKVLTLDSQNLVALRCLAELARERGDTDEAERRLEELLETDPRNEEAREALEELRGGRVGAWEDQDPDAWEEVAEPDDAADEATWEEAEEPVAADEALEEDAFREPEDAAASEPAGDPWDEPREPGPAEDVPAAPEGETAEQGWGEAAAEPAEEALQEPRRGKPAEEDAPEAEDPWSPTVWEEDIGAAEDAAAAPDEEESLSDVPASFAEAEEDAEAAVDGAQGDETPGRTEEGSAGDDLQEAPARDKDDEDLLTETLAGLYETQGFYREAVEMYEDLLEQHPDDEDLRRRLEEAKSGLEEAESALEEADAEPMGESPGVDAPVDRPTGIEDSARGASEGVSGEAGGDEAPGDVTAREQLQALLKGEADIGPGGEGAGGGPA